jgi:hypothetical protein
MNVRGICRTSKLCINLPLLMTIQQDKLASDVLASRGKVWSSTVIRVVHLQWAVRQFLSERIDLVEKQDGRSFDEPSRVTDGIKQIESFLHATDGLVFKEGLVIIRDSN